MDHVDTRPSRPLPGKRILPEIGVAERLAEFQRTEKIRAEILAKSRYSDDGVNVRILASGVTMVLDYETALNALLMGTAQLV